MYIDVAFDNDLIVFHGDNIHVVGVRIWQQYSSLCPISFSRYVTDCYDSLYTPRVTFLKYQIQSGPFHQTNNNNNGGFRRRGSKLLGYLMDDKEKLDVISIIGMPGLGKTTLARKIFENEQVCYEFPIRIWVYVSQRFNSRDVFLNILRKFTSNDMSGLSDEELAQSVRACLSKEKFLLVMDDVWRPEDWQVIQTVLPSSNKLSKVLITSRLSTVGESAKVGHSTEPHNLRFFTLEESWELLQLEVFGN